MEATFDFTESDAVVRFKRAGDTVLISASYAPALAQQGNQRSHAGGADLLDSVKKSLHFSLRRSIPYRRVGQQATDACADLNDFFGGVDGSIINVQASWKPTLVESGPQRLDECIDILGREELTVATDAGGIVQKGDEPCLDRGATDVNIRADEGIGLPHFVSMGFGESQALFVI